MLTSIALADLPIGPDGLVFVNGVAIAMTADGKLKVQADANVLTREQFIKDPSAANTPTRRIYFVLQSMLLDPANKDTYRMELLDLLADRFEAASLRPVLHSIATLARLAERGDYHEALVLCQRLIDFDDAILKDFPNKG